MQIQLPTLPTRQRSNNPLPADLRQRAESSYAHLQQLMLLGLVSKCLTEERLERFAATQRVAKVDLMVSIEARAQTPIGGEPYTVARAAIRVCHRCDDPHRPRSAGEPIVLRRAISLRWTTIWRKGAEGRDALEHFVARDNVVPCQFAKVADRHQLDEAHMPGVFDRQARKILDLVIVGAAKHHHVDLERRQPGRFGGTGRADGIEPEVAPGYGRNAIGTQ